VREGAGGERRKEQLGILRRAHDVETEKGGGVEKDQEPWTGQAWRKKGNVWMEKNECREKGEKVRNGEVKDREREKKGCGETEPRPQTDWDLDTPCACQAECSFDKVSICNEKVIVHVKHILLLKDIGILCFC
jgi:hypothetical protein